MKKNIMRVILLMGVFLLPVLLRGAIPATERAALIAIYNSTAGDAWTDNTGWKTEPLEADGFAAVGSEGDWSGVTVENDHVTRFYGYYNNLNGSLPEDMQNLTHLEIIELAECTLESIPPFLGNMTSLRFLGIKQCTLTVTTIPAELGNLSNLETLGLGYSGLTGTIPPELGNLSNLEEFFIMGWNITGTIPPELGNLTNLAQFTIYKTGVSGEIPKELGNLTELQGLGLSYSPLSGTLPDELANLTGLYEIHISGTDLSGELPAWLGNFVNLHTMHINENNFSGEIPEELGNLTNLGVLGLMENQLTGTIPSSLGNITGMLALYLRGNQLTGPIPAELLNLLSLSNMGIGYNALYTDNSLVENFLTGIEPEWKNTQTLAPIGLEAEALSPTTAKVDWLPVDYRADAGGYRVYHSKSANGPWTYVETAPGKLTGSYTMSGLVPGATHYITIKTQTNAHDDNPNTVLSKRSEPVNVTLPEIPAGEDAAPFGYLETPTAGLQYSGSFAVTGWALDDMEVERVEILSVSGVGSVYIGDAVFVEGARPDVEALYPDYPNAKRAGWGYMLLSNFLPNQGNGQYTIVAVAYDARGHRTVLGSSTIMCDNANAVKPFGAIDTPTQGGRASGDEYAVFGWALTPQPNTIPMDGSTITVWVDGQPLGNPMYNIYRKDVATLFPDYANSNGAMGLFMLDTTGYEDGVHQIAWSVSDDAGNTEGIGSRYFSINNENGDADNARATTMTASTGARITPEWMRTFTGRVQKRDADAKTKSVSPKGKRFFNTGTTDIEGIQTQRRATVETRVLKPLAIRLNNDARANKANGHYRGFLLVGDSLRPLPVGSSLNAETGEFHWMPGPGFVGEYRLVFLANVGTGGVTRQDVTVRVLPESLRVKDKKRF